MDQQVEKDLTERVLRPGSGGGGGGNNTLNIVHTKILHNHWKVYYVYFITWNGLKAQLNLLLAIGGKKKSLALSFITYSRANVEPSSQSLPLTTSLWCPWQSISCPAPKYNPASHGHSTTNFQPWLSRCTALTAAVHDLSPSPQAKVKEGTSLPMPKLLTAASCRKVWKRISAESTLMSSLRIWSVKGVN